MHEDNVLRSACLYTLAGLPKYEQAVPTQLCESFGVRGSLSVSNGLLTYGNRIIVPKDMLPAILDKIHQGRQGIGKCLEGAKDSVWWPRVAVTGKVLWRLANIVRPLIRVIVRNNLLQLHSLTYPGRE